MQLEQLEQYAPYAYYAFAAVFALYVLDGAYYTIVAAAARFAESSWPVIGHPAYQDPRDDTNKLEAAQRVSGAGRLLVWWERAGAAAAETSSQAGTVCALGPLCTSLLLLQQ